MHAPCCTRILIPHPTADLPLATAPKCGGEASYHLAHSTHQGMVGMALPLASHKADIP